MDKRVNKLITTYITDFKDAIRAKITELDFEDKTKINDLLEHIYDYERLVLSKDDLNKRKRIKNAIPSTNRCNAYRSNFEQCTRRRKDNCEYCGTHSKGTPHGIINMNPVNENVLQKLEVIAEDIGGIVYFVDKYNNVYKTEDVLAEKENPQIIAKYVKKNGKITIPDFGLV
jgi:hypothetical protein